MIIEIITQTGESEMTHEMNYMNEVFKTAKSELVIAHQLACGGVPQTKDAFGYWIDSHRERLQDLISKIRDDHVRQEMATAESSKFFEWFDQLEK